MEEERKVKRQISDRINKTKLRAAPFQRVLLIVNSIGNLSLAGEISVPDSAQSI